jgi:ubiquinone biosynthesis protein
MPTGFANRSAWRAVARTPQALRERLERLGPTFVKIGQYLALRPDLVPNEYSLELMRLFDQAPPFAWQDAQRIIGEDLPAPSLEIFSHIEPVPIAAASLAQVHAARLKDGTEVAVKIQRPNIREQIFRDFRRARLIARLMNLTGVEPTVTSREFVREVNDWLLQELDFKHELANITRLHRRLADLPINKVPRPYPEYSGSRVLTMERLHGVRVSGVLEAVRRDRTAALADLESQGIDGRTFATNLLTSVLHQIFEVRFFHADLHPGNLLILPGDVVGFVDFGLCDELDDVVRRQQSRYLSAILEQDIAGMFRAASTMLVPTDRTDIEAFQNDFHAEMAEWTGVSASQKTGSDGDRSPIGRAMVGVMRAARNNGYQIPVRILSLYRALLGAETVASQLAPEVSLRLVGRAFFRERQLDDVRTSLEPEAVARLLLSLHHLANRSPMQLANILTDVADQRFFLNVNVSERARVTRLQNQRIRLLATSILSVGVASLLAAPLPNEAVLRPVMWIVLALVYLVLLVQWRQLK